MERDTNQMPQNVLCRSGCGFYGNPATDGLCSKCYKDALKKKQSTPTPPMTGRSSPAMSASNDTNNQQSSTKAESAAISAVTTASPTVTGLPSSSNNQSDKTDSEGATACAASSLNELSSDKTDSMDTDSNTDGSDSSQKDQKKKKSRCFTCRKKVGLTGFECRCGGLFCSLHRYSDKHECKFDYKQLGAQEIRKNNPLIVGKKIQKI